MKIAGDSDNIEFVHQQVFEQTGVDVEVQGACLPAEAEA